MKAASPYKAKNHSVLRKIVENFPHLSPLEDDIWGAYLNYWPNKGSPATVTPLNYPAEIAATLKSVMNDCYKSARVRDNLSWLSDYRDGHGYAHCPMCGAAHGKTLEHYLPREHYPEFAVFALNLVPSCITCNQHRSSTANAPNVALPMLHPFFDGSDLNEGFLYAVNQGTYSAPDFVPRIQHPNPVIAPRVAEHVRRSVDIPLFNTWLVELWLSARGWASRYTTIPLLTTEIGHRLSDETRLKGPNTWDAAFLRCVISDQQAIAWLVANPI